MGLRNGLSNNLFMQLTSFLCWSCLYLWCGEQYPYKTPEWWSRIVTVLHGIVASIVGLAQCQVFNITKARLTCKIGPEQYALMVWSWGYFAFDLLWCLLYWRDNALMLVHHFSALAAISIYMGKTTGGCSFACMLAMMEVTNPLLQARWFLRNGGYGKNTIYFLVEIVYLTSFVALRGIFGTYLICKILLSDLFYIDEKAISLVFYIVSLLFVKDIFGYVLHRYKDKVEMPSGCLGI